LGRIPDETIQLVRERVDVVDLVGRYVSLKPAGRNHKGLCPFHHEKTPSFTVSSERGTFKCFGCGEGGNVFHFLMRLENLTFPEAVRTLAAHHGIEVPETGGAERSRRDPIFEANSVAQASFRAALAEPGSPGAAYLAGRGIDAATIEHFGIGYAPDRWETVTQALRAAHVPAAVGEEAGLLKPGRSGSHYDLLRGRVVFPIRDVRGRIVGFGGRAIRADQEPKYLNTPESPVFHKRRAFFGFPAALEPIRREGRAVVVEGYFDLVALQRAGIEGAVATCGTALTEEHARELRRRTRQVVLLFDGDEAGQKAVERALEVLLPADLRVQAAVLPAGEDPDDFLAREGAEALRRLVDQAPAALDVAIRRAVARGCATPAQKADAVAALVPLLVKLGSPVERGAWEEQLALATGANPDDVRAAVRAQARGADPREELPVAPRVEPAEVKKLRQLARSLVEHPHLVARFQPDPLTGLEGHPVVELINTLVDAAGADRRVDLEEISVHLSEEARSLLYALAADDHPPEESVALQTVDDANRWLAGREERAAQRALTEQLRRGDGDVLEILRHKQSRGGSVSPPSSNPPPPERTH
jgi:DNA primase